MDTAVQILLYTCGLRIATADYDVFNNLSFFIITVQKAGSTKKWFLKGSNVSTSVGSRGTVVVVAIGSFSLLHQPACHLTLKQPHLTGGLMVPKL